MFVVKVGVSQQYNIYTKTAIFLEKVVASCTGTSRRASDLVQYIKVMEPKDRKIHKFMLLWI